MGKQQRTYTNHQPLPKNKTIHKLIQDQRFQKAGYDPTFITPGNQFTKTKIDQRFNKMMTDPAFQTNATVDRYGRQNKNSQRNKQLENYYYKEEQQNSNQNLKDNNNKSIKIKKKNKDKNNLKKNKNNLKDNKNKNTHISQDQQIGQSIEQKQQQFVQNQQYSEQQINNIAQQDEIQDLHTWMQNYDEQSSQEQMSEEVVQEGKDVWSQDEDVVQNSKSSNRLALCNYDWMKINAKDLMLLFNSFKPSTGVIHSIQVYQSDYGRQRLQKEQKHGPQGIWSNSKQLDQNKLRRYEKDRLKYYYAVINCDSVKTAEQIYRECDGTQFENSNLHFDLRFIPTQTVFDKKRMKEQCKEMPVRGEVRNFVNKAMGHSNVGLSWQDPQLSVTASLKQMNWDKMTPEQMDNIDWGVYLDEDKLQEEQDMKQLSLTCRPSDWKEEARRKQSQQDDIEITFQSGFNNSKPQTLSLKKQKKSLNEKRREAERVKEEKQNKLKEREHLELIVQNQENKQFNVNLQDQRFKAVYSDPNYDIDPVDPRFDHRKIGNIFKELVKRKRHRQ